MKEKINKNILILSTSFFIQFANVAIILALVYYLKIKFQIDAKLIGIIMSINTISYFIFCLLLMRITEKITPLHCIEIGLFSLFVYSFLIINVNNLTIICILQIFYGFSFCFIWPPLSGWLNRNKEGDRLGKTNSFFNLSWSSGSAFGPIIAGILIGKNLTFTFIISGFIFFILLIILLVISNIYTSLKIEKSEKINADESSTKDKSTPVRYYSWIGLFLVFLIYTVINNIFPIYALDVLNLGSEWSGSIISIKGFITVFFFWILGKNSWWHFKLRYTIGSQTVLAIFCLVASYIKSIAAITIFFSLIGILLAFMYESSLFHGMSGTKHKSRRMTIHELSLSLGTVGGNIFGGKIYNKLGYNNIMKYMVLIIILFLIVEGIIFLYQKRKYTTYLVKQKKM